jgi:hypothetical protein
MVIELLLDPLEEIEVSALGRRGRPHITLAMSALTADAPRCVTG